MKDFRWLHFSDLHLKPKDSDFDSGVARDELIKTLREEDFGSRDELYVFITGDIVNRGTYSEQQDEWISEFKEALGVPNERIFWAPGNHDVPRGRQAKSIIGDLRDKQHRELSSLDDLRNEEENSEEETAFFYLAVNRMKKYREKYEVYFNRSLTDEELLELHQVYELDELRLLVLNTSITSVDDADERNLYLKSAELRKQLRSTIHSADKPLFVIGHHGTEFWASGERKDLENLFDTNQVDVYLCGHAHKPQARELTECRRKIWEFTCGGGIPDHYSEFVFYYGHYDASRNGIHLIPYVYGASNEWQINYNNTRSIKEDNFFGLSLLKDDATSNSEKMVKAKKTCIPWNLEKLAWQLPRGWDPDIDPIVPIDDRNAISLPVILQGNREGYVVFLATTMSEGLGEALNVAEEKYLRKSENLGWKRRHWHVCDDMQVPCRKSDAQEDGLVITMRAEKLVTGKLGEMIREWGAGKDSQKAVIVNIWSESPYLAARYAQKTFRNLEDMGTARVYLVAELGEDGIKGRKDTQEIDLFLETLEKRELSEEEEIRELLEFREQYPTLWISMLKKHALKRGLSGWLCGYRAACGIHTHVSQWLGAAGSARFFWGDCLIPYVLRLEESEMDTLIWEVFCRMRRFPAERWEKVLFSLLDMGSRSIKLLVQEGGSAKGFETVIQELKYTDVARLGRWIGKKECAMVIQTLKSDRCRRWILLMSCPYSMETLLDCLSDEEERRRARLLLSQCPDGNEDMEILGSAQEIRCQIFEDRL